MTTPTDITAHDKRGAWVMDACRRLLRPVARLAMAYGLKHPQLAEVLRQLMIEQAREVWVRRGVHTPNVSQLSVTSGLNRKLVTAHLRAEGESLAVTETSLASRVFTHWLHLAHSQPDLATLSIADTRTGPSFEAMVRKLVAGDVHHRTILEELVRLGLAQEDAGTVQLLKAAFVPSDDERSMLAFAADNGRDHLLAALSNVAGGQEPYLEQAVFADGLGLDGAWRIQQFTRDQWTYLHNQLVAKMQSEIDQVEGKGDHRIRVGIYVYHEPVATQQDREDKNNG